MPKLIGRLAKPVTTEEQVLFVLVGIRKLLEIAGKYREPKYSDIRFFCDWAVHPEIYRKGWGQDNLIFFDVVVKEKRTWEQLSPSQQDRFQKILGLDDLRRTLIDFLAEYGIKPIALFHVLGWRLFLQAFVVLVFGCPLKLKGDHIIEQVEVGFRSLGPLQYELEWCFKRRDDPLPFVWVSPGIVDIPDGHFGRDGKRQWEEFEAHLVKLGYTW